MSGVAIAVALFFMPGLFTDSILRIIVSVVALLLGAAGVAYIMLAPAVVWIITANEILIGHQRPWGKLRTRVVAKKDIRGLQVPNNEREKERFQLIFTLASGERLTSPPIADVTQVHDTIARIAAQFDVPNVEEPVNPLDASNPEIRLGAPVRPAVGHDTRIITLIISGLCTIPYAYKFWNDLPFAIAEIIIAIVGPIVAFLLFRYAYRLAGTFWIIGHDEIRVERLSLDAKPTAETVTGSDIQAIGIQPGHSDDSDYLVEIGLIGGRKLRSPDVGTEDVTRAVVAEIVRSLAIASEKVRQ